ncbi:bifunctional adenosylcobinamide kinase/adenosylcobinamide-phosphate guanylyltransferase, partial [Muricomes intestini]
RMLEEGNEFEGLAKNIAQKNPGLIIVTDEIGYGLVPIDAFERRYRELTGRICTEVAAYSCRVDRVVCGVGMPLKGDR